MCHVGLCMCHRSCFQQQCCARQWPAPPVCKRKLKKAHGVAREARVSVGKGVEALQWPWGPAGAGRFSCAGCNTVWECPLRRPAGCSAEAAVTLQHCLGVPFMAQWRPAGCSAEAAVTGKQALQSALGLDGSSVQAEALSRLPKPVTNESHVFLYRFLPPPPVRRCSMGMAPAPKKKVDEPSSSYYSETPPLAETRRLGPTGLAGCGGTDEEPKVVAEPKEAVKTKEPKQGLTESRLTRPIAASANVALGRGSPASAAERRCQPKGRGWDGRLAIPWRRTGFGGRSGKCNLSGSPNCRPRAQAAEAAEAKVKGSPALSAGP